MTDAWRDLSPLEMEARFNPRWAVTDYQVFVDRRVELNRSALSRLGRRADISYGPATRHVLDVYPAAVPRAPVHVFVHGGFWRAQSKDDFAFVAARLVEDGVTVVVPSYELCPGSSLDDAVRSGLRAIAWVRNHIAAFDGDPHRITISGNSAGAHLCAAALAADWTEFGADSALIKGAVMVSGIFDPAPVIMTSINEAVRLTPEAARKHNYELLPPNTRASVKLVVGGLEPRAWMEQTVRYADHLRRHAVCAEVVVSEGYHHYSIVEQYLDPESDVLRAIRSLLNVSPTKPLEVTA